jgi:hypothetical protein
MSAVPDPKPTKMPSSTTGAPVTVPTQKPSYSPVADPPTRMPTKSPVTSTSCDNYCNGTYPYGCAENLDWPWKYMCEPSGTCHYTYTQNSTGPYDDNSIWCTYKTQTPTNPRTPQTRFPVGDGRCDNYCPGTYPYGCAGQVDGAVIYICLPSGGCYYANSIEDNGPYSK